MCAGGESGGQREAGVKEERLGVRDRGAALWAEVLSHVRGRG